MKPGRKPLPLTKRIPDTPENVARAIVQGPPKKKWRYEKLRRPALPADTLDRDSL